MKLNMKDLRLEISQGYKFSSDLLLSLLADNNDFRVTLDKGAMNNLVVELNDLKQKLDSDDCEDIEACIEYIKSYEEQTGETQTFSYMSNNSKPRVVSDGIQFTGFGKLDTKLNITDIIKLDGLENDVICFDYTRLLDWLAFEIGHTSFDDRTMAEFDSLLGLEGTFYPADGKLLDSLVPSEFEREIADLGLDTETDTNYYSKASKHYYNYFMQDCTKKASKCQKIKKAGYIKFQDMLDVQNDYLVCALLFYLMAKASSYVIPFHLLEIQRGRIYFTLGANKYNLETYKKSLLDAVIVTVLDRRFEYIPKISYINNSGVVKCEK